MEYNKYIPYGWLFSAPVQVRRQYATLQAQLQQLATTGLAFSQTRLHIGYEIRSIQVTYNDRFPFASIQHFCDYTKEPLFEGSDEIQRD